MRPRPRRLLALVAVTATAGAAAWSAAEPAPAAAGIGVHAASLSGVAGGLLGPITGGVNPVTATAGALTGWGLSALSSAALGAAAAALHEAGTVIDRTTAPHLQSTWFSSTYWRVAGLAALLTLPFLFAAAVHAVIRSDLALLGRAAFGYLPLALIGVSLAAPLVMLLLAATDQMSAVVERAGAGGGANFLLRTAAETSGLSALDGSVFLAFAIGLCTLGAALALTIEMLVRESAVYVVALMLPLAFAALVWPARRVWATRLVELLVALILSKFVIVGVLSLAGAAYGASGSPSTSRLLTAMSLLILSTFAPWVMLRLLPFTELAAGAAGALRAELPRLPRLSQPAMAAADGAATWLESLTSALRRPVDEASEASASQEPRLSASGDATRPEDDPPSGGASMAGSDGEPVVPTSAGASTDAGAAPAPPEGAAPGPSEGTGSTGDHGSGRRTGARSGLDEPPVILGPEGLDIPIELPDPRWPPALPPGEPTQEDQLPGAPPPGREPPAAESGDVW